MNLEDTTFVTYRRRGKYTENLDLEEIKLEDIELEDMTDSQEDRGKCTTKEEDRMDFHSLISALNDLAKGQKEVLLAISRLAINQGKTNINYRSRRVRRDPLATMEDMNILI